MFKVGDKVRFNTDEPRYVAWFDDGILTVIHDYPNGDYEVLYPDGLEQTVHADDIELVIDSPVRREVVPGRYGRVTVGDQYGARGIWFEIAEDNGALILTAEELDNVAMIASQLAEALRDV